MSSSEIDRRRFLEKAAGTAAAFTILPRHVLGGPQFVAPSDKVTLAYIGLGTQGTRELMELLPSNDIQVVAVCDPNKDSNDYVDWSKNWLRNSIRKFIDKPNWREGVDGIPGGREVGREIVETYYASKSPSGNYKGCASYADFRELLEKQKDVDGVKIMTPDHLHATIAIAAMKKGKHVMMHKPIANRLYEARQVLETARATKAATHFIPWDTNGNWGRFWLAAAFVALVIGAWKLRAQSASLLLLWVPLVFYSFSIAYGSVPLHVYTWWPFATFNQRYGLQLLPMFAVSTGVLAASIFLLGAGGRHKGKMVAVILALVVGSYVSVWKAEPQCLAEARRNWVIRNPLNSAVQRVLARLPKNSRFLMDISEHVGVMEQAGIPLRQYH